MIFFKMENRTLRAQWFSRKPNNPPIKLKRKTKLPDSDASGRCV